jgi:soluble lytic murein transglycosylase-like protein
MTLSAAILALILTTSQQYGIDPRVVSVIVYMESRDDAQAENPSGAIGLMGVIHGGVIEGRPSREQLFIPEVNIETGCQVFLDGMSMLDNDLKRGIIAYGVGVGSEAQGKGKWYLREFIETWKMLYPRELLPWEVKQRKGEYE